MASIDIYTKQTCPFCHRAKALLDQKGVKYHEIAIDNDSEKRAEMIDRSQRTTVPQIFIDQRHVGGCDDLFALEQRAQLDPLLNA
ncbi:glutaredoxin 3 [Rosenbergiella epipactidis]|uniref:glutaredoxin 3 n=1 Tax=Rosenbergiella epipactidis TaxID=1544694 RepID=UPI0006645402|nr:glutaredoxin 3 [Rosenbergiella epipactidis]KMV70697.1 glutaredoxin [bacteria symbiont BFo2 of Frankliniella occidentalis]KYP88601.1 glutaredoxin [bacteria symbiont BFo2 of Frankliniella occidentalis]KYP94234.1 glutaredoxin [bacteria symbiont BFo2 of Frankliniella occidentalis]MBT0719196.1 glutaredoxin 3 [Rosenbergiella epipactidis]